LAIAIAACGGDDDGDNPDANNNPDADTSPDAAPPIGIDAPEGGAIFVEHVTLGDTLQAAIGLPEPNFVRTVATAINGMTPEAMGIPTFNTCTNQWANTPTDWPMGIGTSVTYLDVGDMTVSGKNYANDATEWDLPLNTSGTDLFGRPIDEVREYLDSGVSEYIKPGTFFTIEMSGSSEVEPTTWTDAAFVPNSFSVINPGLNDDVTFTAGTDATVEWEEQDLPASMPPNSAMAEVVALASPATGSLVIMCPFVNDPDGAATISGEMIQAYRDTVTAQGGDPDVAILVRNYNNHHIMELPNGDPDNVRRVDVIGIYCFVQLVNIDPAP
jgi:hypothetical protein